jgi:hypothetical protein
MTNEQVKKHNIKMIEFLCNKHGCSDKRKKIHYEQMVLRAWNPHPSQEFTDWWQTQPECGDGVDAVRARNCKVFTDRYKEAVEFGVATLPTDYPTATTPKATA